MKHLIFVMVAALSAGTLLAQKPRITVEGDAKQVTSWSGKDARTSTGYFDDRNYRQQVQIIPTVNGAVVRTEGRYYDGVDVLSIETADRRNLEVAVYRYDFNQDGGYEGFIIYSPKPGEIHIKVYRYINDERPWLVGSFHGLDKITLKGPVVIIPYEYFYEEFAYTHKYAYYDHDFYELLRHDPEETGTEK